MLYNNCRRNTHGRTEILGNKSIIASKKRLANIRKKWCSILNLYWTTSNTMTFTPDGRQNWYFSWQLNWTIFHQLNLLKIRRGSCHDSLAKKIKAKSKLCKTSAASIESTILNPMNENQTKMSNPALFCLFLFVHTYTFLAAIVPVFAHSCNAE